MISDIPAGDGKMANSFLQCKVLFLKLQSCLSFGREGVGSKVFLHVAYSSVTRASCQPIGEGGKGQVLQGFCCQFSCSLLWIVDICKDILYSVRNKASFICYKIYILISYF